MRIFTKNACTCHVIDLSLHFIPELFGFNNILHIERIYAQCIVGNSFSLYCLKTLKPILVRSSWLVKISLYATQVFELVFHSANLIEEVELSTRSNFSSPNVANIVLQMFAAMSFLLLLHLVFI